MVVEDKLRTARTVSIVASTVIALSCGTNVGFYTECVVWLAY